MSPMWMHSGHIFAKGDFTRRGPGTLHGVSGISTCPIRTATSCRLLARSAGTYRRMCCLMIMMPGNAVLFLHSARGTCAAALSFGPKGPRITVFRGVDVSLSAELVSFSTRRQAELLDDRANDGDSSSVGFYAARV